MANKKIISVITPCYNEEGNIEEIYTKVKQVFVNIGTYDYEHIFIDNASEDKTVSILESIVQRDPKVRIIINRRNFGFVRSCFYGLLQGHGDANLLIFADLQDPPSLIVDFIQKWEEGYEVVQGVKKKSKEPALLFNIKRLYYYVIVKISEVELIRDASFFSLYDRKVIEELRKIDDPYPYLKGIISELGFKTSEIEYKQFARKRGHGAKFYSAYDFAMLGITSHSNVPLRLATMIGFILSLLSFLVGIITLVIKLLFWNLFPIGIAAIIIGLFLFSSVQLFFIGILGEYIGLINRRSLKRPLVVERARVNFD